MRFAFRRVAEKFIEQSLAQAGRVHESRKRCYVNKLIPQFVAADPEMPPLPTYR
jgi:hypothetical protein